MSKHIQDKLKELREIRGKSIDSLDDWFEKALKDIYQKGLGEGGLEVTWNGEAVTYEKLLEIIDGKWGAGHQKGRESGVRGFAIWEYEEKIKRRHGGGSKDLKNARLGMADLFLQGGNDEKRTNHN